MQRVIPLALLVVSTGVFAQAPEVRFDLGQRLRSFEKALETAPPNETRARAILSLKNVTGTFFSLQFGKAGQMLDEARLLLTHENPTDAERWANALTFTPVPRLVDVTTTELAVKVTRFYTPKAAPPENPVVALTLIDGTGKKLAEATSALDEVPGTVKVPLRSVAPGDYRLLVTVRGGTRLLATSEQAVSLVADLQVRLTALAANFENIKEGPRSTDRESLRRLVEQLTALARGETLETNYPANRLLKETEDGIAAVRKEVPYYGQKRPGEFWLTLGTKGSPRIRLEAPPTVVAGKPLPLVVAQHGAGGSENMFFDGYGDGLVRRLAAERGWILVAPLVGFAGGFNGEMLEEIDKLYPVDRRKVFILGHSMGASATMTAVSREPELYRAAAALGGGGSIKPSDNLKQVGIFVGVGTDDFALNGARSLNASLKKAEVTTVEFKEYRGVEHLTIVQLALRDVFAFFDQSIKK